MSETTTILKGVVHGRTIELDDDAGLPDGQKVNVTIQPRTDQPLAPGEGLRRAFGAWADDASELDAFLQEVRRGRQRPRPEIEP